MSGNEIKELLGAYRQNQARLEYLQLEAEELRRGIAIENSPEMHAISGQAFSFAPPTKKTTSLVETLGLQALDGVTTQTADRWQLELDRMEREIYEKKRAVRLVEIWLSGLTDRERTTIEWHEIDHKTWEALSLASERLFGLFLTAGAIRTISRRAMVKIQDIAM